MLFEFETIKDINYLKFVCKNLFNIYLLLMREIIYLLEFVIFSNIICNGKNAIKNKTFYNNRNNICMLFINDKY